MIALTDYQSAALDTVRDHTSATPITGKDLANLIGLKERDTGKEGADMRSIIHALRVKGYPICATGTGYWWPKDKLELSGYIASFQARVDDQQAAVDALKTGMDKVADSKEELVLSTKPPVAFQLNGMVRMVPAEQVDKFLAHYPQASKI